MPLGARQRGVAVGPSAVPRDPTVSPTPGAAFAAPDAVPGAPFTGVDLKIVRYDEKTLTVASADFEQKMVWQPQEQRGDLLLIDRIVVAHDTFADPVTTIFWSTNDPNFNNSLYKFDFTESPRIVAEYNPPVILPASQTIIVTVGFGPGNRANVHFWYRVGRLV